MFNSFYLFKEARLNDIFLINWIQWFSECRYSLYDCIFCLSWQEMFLSLYAICIKHFYLQLVWSTFLKSKKPKSLKDEALWGWRDCLVVKSSGCPWRGPKFNSQYPHGSSQLSCNSSCRGSNTLKNIHAGKTPIYVK